MHECARATRRGGWLLVFQHGHLYTCFFVFSFFTQKVRQSQSDARTLISIVTDLGAVFTSFHGEAKADASRFTIFCSLTVHLPQRWIFHPHTQISDLCDLQHRHFIFIFQLSRPGSRLIFFLLSLLIYLSHNSCTLMLRSQSRWICSIDTLYWSYLLSHRCFTTLPSHLSRLICASEVSSQRWHMVNIHGACWPILMLSRL